MFRHVHFKQYRGVEVLIVTLDVVHILLAPPSRVDAEVGVVGLDGLEGSSESILEVTSSPRSSNIVPLRQEIWISIVSTCGDFEVGPGMGGACSRL